MELNELILSPWQGVYHFFAANQEGLKVQMKEHGHTGNMHIKKRDRQHE